MALEFYMIILSASSEVISDTIISKTLTQILRPQKAILHQSTVRKALIQLCELPSKRLKPSDLPNSIEKFIKVYSILFKVPSKCLKREWFGIHSFAKTKYSAYVKITALQNKQPCTWKYFFLSYNIQIFIYRKVLDDVIADNRTMVCKLRKSLHELNWNLDLFRNVWNQTIQFLC